MLPELKLHFCGFIAVLRSDLMARQADSDSLWLCTLQWRVRARVILGQSGWFPDPHRGVP